MPSRAAAAPKIDASTGGARVLRILLVEDSRTARAVARRALTKTGVAFEICEAVNLAAGFEALSQMRFDCALVDYRLPDGDGLALLAELEARGGCETPIVILTALNDEALAVHALQAGAQDYLVKGSIDGPALLRSIRYAIERKRAAALQVHLLHVDRMAALGTLAAGAAHEINNPLAYITANLAMVADCIEELSNKAVDSAAYAAMQELVRDSRIGADRVRDIVRDMRAFTRPSDRQAEQPVKLDAALDQAISMAWNQIRHRARLVKDYQVSPSVMANETRLGQVFLNLLINAVHAIPEGRAPANEIRVTIRSLPDDRVEAVIEDTGVGIPRENLSRIFDPFFTTKPVGSGTGLGLFMCEGIVRGAGGELMIDSTVGKGTSVHVILPAATKLPQVARTEPRRTRDLPSKKVLVVDDDAMVLLSLRRLLEPQHTLVTTTSALEALRRIREGESFDVIVCDLMMPEMTGMQLHAEVASLAPHLARRMLFITGGAFTPAAQQFLDGVPNLRIEKPFDLQDLRELVFAVGSPM